MELLKDISLIVGIWAAIISFVMILYNLDAWRREHIGKRKIELAEEILVLFYEAADVIRFMRNPLSSTEEMKGIAQDDNESQEQYQARKDASVVFYRYNQNQELFNKIHASRYRFMAQIGKDEAVPFDELRKIVNDIMFSARMLARLWPRKHFRDDKQKEKHWAQINKYEAIFWGGIEEEDPINPRIDKVIEDIEKVCQPIIEGKGTLHGYFNKNL